MIVPGRQLADQQSFEPLLPFLLQSFLVLLSQPILLQFFLLEFFFALPAFLLLTFLLRTFRLLPDLLPSVFLLLFWILLLLPQPLVIHLGFSEIRSLQFLLLDSLQLLHSWLLE